MGIQLTAMIPDDPDVPGLKLHAMFSDKREQLIKALPPATTAVFCGSTKLTFTVTLTYKSSV